MASWIPPTPPEALASVRIVVTLVSTAICTAHAVPAVAQKLPKPKFSQAVAFDKTPGTCAT